jgi:hypothetical protein
MILIGALAGAFAALAPYPPALAEELPQFGLADQTKCRVCEPALNLTKSVSVPMPEHAIVLDFGNGVFWRNDRLVVVDLDRAEARTYRFPAEEQQPTKLVLVGMKSLTPDVMRDLVRKANLVWNPPPLEGPPPLPVPDVFETVYVVNGPVMAAMAGRTERSHVVRCPEGVHSRGRGGLDGDSTRRSRRSETGSQEGRTQKRRNGRPRRNC